ncbi:MAG: LEA type 2 family protein [Myxococcales bacterium]|nr:LEA type 2 family protein [Myxococcales bacterium]MCB9643113.1 LEA type 2 family protein [Myxococcales bacterium]
MSSFQQMHKMIRFFLIMSVAMPLFGCKTLSGLLDSAYQKPKMEYVRMRLRDVSFEGVSTDFDFNLTNPNAVSVTFATLAYKLDIDGYTLFSGRSNKGVSVAANATSPITVPFNVQFKRFAKALMSFFQNKRFVRYDLSVTFGIQVPVLGVVEFPFTLSGKIPVPQLPKVSVVSVSPPRINPFPPTAEFSFRIKLENRAAFPVALKGFNYAIEVSGANLGGGQTTGQSLAGGRHTVLDVPLNVNLIQVGFAVANAIRSKQFPYKLRGTIDMGMFKIPVDVGGNVKF